MRHVRIFFSVIAIVVMILCLVRAFHGEPLFPIPIQPSSQAPAASSDGQGVQIGQIQQRLEDLSKSQDDLQRESLALKIPERMATGAVFRLEEPDDIFWRYQGREATAEEIVASIDKVIPELRKSVQGRIVGEKAVDELHAALLELVWPSLNPRQIKVEESNP